MPKLITLMNFGNYLESVILNLLVATLRTQLGGKSICTQNGSEISVCSICTLISHENRVIGKGYRFMLVKGFEVFLKPLSIETLIFCVLSFFPLFFSTLFFMKPIKNMHLLP